MQLIKHDMGLDMLLKKCSILFGKLFVISQIVNIE